MEQVPLRPSSSAPTRPIPAGHLRRQERPSRGGVDVVDGVVELLESTSVACAMFLVFCFVAYSVPKAEAKILLRAVLAMQFLKAFCYICFITDYWVVQSFAFSWWYFYNHMPILPVAAYGVGLMLKSWCPYWVVASLFLACNSEFTAAYSVQEDKQNLRCFAKQALSLACLIVGLLQAARPWEKLSLLLGFLVFLLDLKISSRAMIPASDICMAASDHVRFQAPSTSPYARIVVAVGSLGSYRSAVAGCTTYQDILDRNYSSGININDICLSSALFLQLLQRCAVPQVIGRSSVSFLFNDLLAVAEERRDYTIIFNLVDLEMFFMYDYFFSAHGSPSSTSYRLYVMYFISKTAFLLSIVISVLQLNKAHEILDSLASVALVALVNVAFCSLQFVDYLTSNRPLVSYICERARDSRHGIGSSLLLRILGTICRHAAGHQKVIREKRLGQYSLVEDFDCPSLVQMLIGRLLGRPQRGTLPIVLPTEVRTWIIDRAIKPKATTSDVPYPASWWEIGCPGELSWTLYQETEIHTILIWHIATWFSDKTVDRNEVSSLREHRVATKLSRYCAHLVAFHPELLPGHPSVTRTIFDEAVEEAEDSLKGEASSDERYKKMRTWTTEEESSDQGIQDSPDLGMLKLGVRLGRQLLNMNDSGYDVWKIMADFWAEMLLLVAQSANPNAHIEHLAGEFVTHLWALLSNAGIQPESTAIRRNINDGGNSSSGSSNSRYASEYKGKGKEKLS
ncbi:hypothetical protein ACP4OV_003081 [Aristida adscensionis]